METGGRTGRLVFLTIALSLFLLAGLLPGCRFGRSGNAVMLRLGAYTTPREAYRDAIIPAFIKYWKEKTGQDVGFQESYVASGAQARAIIGGSERYRRAIA
jgi:sulfate transport system substrate-binding protein